MTIALIKALAPKVDPAIIEQAVSDWLDEHPEATTTVEDGSITEAKLSADLINQLTTLDYVNFIASNNLTVTGYRIQTNGKLTTSSGYNASPFIPVKAGTKIKAGMYCSNTNCVLAYYTTNEGNPEATYTVVGISVNNITETEYTVPNNGFIRFCSSNSKSYFSMFLSFFIINVFVLIFSFGDISGASLCIT